MLSSTTQTRVHARTCRPLDPLFDAVRSDRIFLLSESFVLDMMVEIFPIFFFMSQETLPVPHDEIPTLSSEPEAAPESGVREIPNSDFRVEGTAPISSNIEVSESMQEINTLPTSFSSQAVPDYEIRAKGTMPVEGDENLPPFTASHLEEEEPGETLKAA